MKSICCLLVFLCTLSLHAQIPFDSSTGTHRDFSGSFLRGEVVASDGSPVPYASVLVIATFGTQQVTADASGRFELANLQPGNYQVTTSSGNREARETVAVSRGGAEVTLRLDAPGLEQKPGGASVSAQQLQVPGKARESYQKAVEQVQRHNYDKASGYVSKAIHQYSCFADALALKGILELQAGQAEATIEDTQKAINCDSSNAQAYFVMGSAFNSLDRPQDAIRTVQLGIRFRPDAWQPYFEMGKALFTLGRFREAIPNLKRAENLSNGSFALIHGMLGSALCEVGDYPDAAVELRMFLKENPDGPLAAKVRDSLNQIEAKTNPGTAQR